MDEQAIKALADALGEAERATHKAFDAGWGPYNLGQADREVQAAQTEAHTIAVAADDEHDRATAAAAKLIEEIEAQAEAAKRAILAANKDTLDAARATCHAAWKVREAANAAGRKLLEDASAAYRQRHNEAVAVAQAAERKARIALALAVLGGPAVIPAAPLRPGARRWLSVHVGAVGQHFAARLDYRLHNGHKQRDEQPSVSLTLVVQLPPACDPRQEMEIPVRSHGLGVYGATLREAIRAAEDAGIAEGWLVREEVTP